MGRWVPMRRASDNADFLQWRRTEEYEHMPDGPEPYCICCGEEPKVSESGKRLPLEHNWIMHKNWRVEVGAPTPQPDALRLPPPRPFGERDDD